MGKLWVVLLILILTGGVGWVKNAIKLVNLDFEPNYKAEVIRVIALVPPIGAVVGWLTFEEEEDNG